MVTITILLLLIFVPPARLILRGLLGGLFAMLGVAFLLTRNSGGSRRGF